MSRVWPFQARVDDTLEKQLNRPLNGACPDFFCVGAQRGGTTWLYQQLNSHPDFWMPPRKELHYFDGLGKAPLPDFPRAKDERDLCFLAAIKSLSAQPFIDFEKYARLFELKASLLSGDITPAYSTLNDEIIERVVRQFPQLKVIFLARDPVERAWSHLCMGVRRGRISSLNVTDAEEVIRNLLQPGVLLRSHPSKIVARWRRYVHPDLFRIYFFDDLERNPAALRRSIVEFLGGDPEKLSRRVNADQKSNEGVNKLQLTDKVRSRVACFFEPELKACAAELGGPAREWPARYGFSFLLLLTGLADNLDLLLWFDWML